MVVVAGLLAAIASLATTVMNRGPEVVRGPILVLNRLQQALIVGGGVDAGQREDSGGDRRRDLGETGERLGGRARDDGLAGDDEALGVSVNRVGDGHGQRGQVAPVCVIVAAGLAMATGALPAA